MSNAVITGDTVPGRTPFHQATVDEKVPEPSEIELPKVRRAISLRPYYALLMAAVFAPVLLFASVAWQYRAFMLRDAINEVGRTVELSAHQAHDLLQMHRITAQRVDEFLHGMSWVEITKSEAVHNYLARVRDENPQIANIYLADASGTVLSSSAAFPQPPVSAADRDYFRAIQMGEVSTAVGGIQMGRTVPRLNFNVARRRTGPNDTFDGVIIVSALQSFFSDFWHALVPEGDAVFGLYGDDGRVLARFPPGDLKSPILTPNSPLLEAASRAPQGTFESVSTIDGIERFTAFQHIPDFNLFVAHGISRTSVLENWRSQVAVMAAFFAPAAAALTALALLTLRRARHEQYAFAEWEQTARRLHDEESKTLSLNQTLRKRATELEASNAELETFSYSVSHDLRTPLRAIDGYSAVLLQDYPDKLDSEGKRLLVVVRQATNKMGRLIDDILDFSRTGRLPMNLTNVDMKAQVQDVVDEAKKHLGDRRVRFEISNMPNAQADAAMIRRVWFKLIDNAVKFTAPKANAAITIGGKRTENGKVVYSIIDNGIGFDRQFLGMLFGVGHRLVGVEFEGCGVGLAIVKRIVTRHNGQVWADGIPNEGASFYFSLPVLQLDDR